MMKGRNILKKRRKNNYLYRYHTRNEPIPFDKFIYWWDWEGKKHFGHFRIIKYMSMHLPILTDIEDWYLHNFSDLVYWKYKT